MSVLGEVLSANGRYAATFGSKRDLLVPPARGFAILTCMDARLDPARLAGLSEGDAHVIRNAGGRASDDAIRSLVISCRVLGTTEFFVIHHTGCGMELVTDERMREALGPDQGKAGAIDWLGIEDREGSLVEDVARIRAHPLVPGGIPIHGFLYEVKSGRLVEVPAATAAGRVRAELG